MLETHGTSSILRERILNPKVTHVKHIVLKVELRGRLIIIQASLILQLYVRCPQFGYSIFRIRNTSVNKTLRVSNSHQISEENITTSKYTVIWTLSKHKSPVREENG